MSDATATRSAAGPGADSPTTAPGHAPVIRRTFLGQVAWNTLGRWGARIGLAWLGLLVLAAVWAPWLANSHPLLWKHEGRIASPLFEHLTPVDAILLVSFFAAVVLACLRRIPGGHRVRAWAWLTLWTVPVAAHREVWRWLHAPAEPSAWRWTLVIVAVLALAAVLVAIPLFPRVRRRLAVGVALAAAVIAVAGGLFPIQVSATQVLSQYREAAAAGEVEWVIHAPIAYSPNDRQRDSITRVGVDPRLRPPSWEHLMGTTDRGEDLLSRMIHASRIALAIGLIATGIAVTIGIVVGALMGYFSGWVDLLGMRLVEIFSAIPVIFLLIMIVAFYGRSLYLMMVIIGLTGWVGYAIYIRAEFLKLRGMDYVQAARAVGAPLRSILFRHMLPNGVTPVLVLASFGIASAILTESTLSFLGLGLVEEPSWGQMLNQARTAGSHWGLVIYPGLAIFLTVFAFNLIGEALRDALDPHIAART